ncbi:MULTISPECIES: type-F conjugative transfer system mating-pair stabilization protein TraN [Pseudescherichia]|uniref:type-F conjugative transfer system mating-pair stabilization protein TraN n=1 Tax=Pseudescherichia TaxID=2055880 RepID=UPI0035E43373
MKGLFAAMLMLMPALVLADAASDAFNAGASFGKGSAGQGTGSLANPGGVTGAIPGYSANPPQSGYYGGVTGSDGGISGLGQAALGGNGAGQAVLDSGNKNPLPTIDPAAPFITIGKAAENDAAAITNGTSQQCTQSSVSKSVFEQFTCDRDVMVEKSCTRNGKPSGSMGAPVATTKTITIPPEDFVHFGRQFKVTIPEAIPNVTYAELIISGNAGTINTVGSFMGTPLVLDRTGPVHLNFFGPLLAGQVLTSSEFCAGNCNVVMKTLVQKIIEKRDVQFTLVLNSVAYTQTFVPSVNWSESCAVDKNNAVSTGSVCTSPGGYQTVTVDGVPRQVYSDCWQYTDTYMTSSGSSGNCGSLMNNSACTVNGVTCQQQSNGYCEHETVSYECQTVYSSTGLVCGGQYFCQNGDCSDTEGAGDSGFDTAVAKLAGLASAGEDVANLQDSINVKAFSGQTMSCRKAVAGFSNCCKDSGWGQDAGLSACNDDELALGKAKAKKITVSLGERCDHSVLGVCVQKSQVYCVFGGKLARIIQEQGRRDQLHVSFGSGSSPDCRGITVPELQSIDFDKINFADFYEDLLNNQRIPDTGSMVQQVKDRIAAQVNQQGGGR